MLKIFAGAILSAVLISGCGSLSLPTQETPSDTAKLNLINTERTGTEGVKNEVLTFTMRNPQTLNPLKNEDNTVDVALKLIFEPLFNISEEQSVVANMGESYELSESGMQITIKLKEGLKWQDGEPVTAEDITYSLYTIKNAPESSIYKSCLANVSGYEAVDDLTAIIYYNSPYSGCIYNLCFPVIPKHYYRWNDSADFAPMGSGPYGLDDYNSREYRLSARDGINGRPEIENVKIIISPDRETDYAAFSGGVTSVLNTGGYEWNSYFSGKNCGRAIYSSNAFEYLGFNNKKEIFENQAVRAAIAHAVDRQQIVSAIYMNYMEPALTPVNPTAYMSSEEAEAVYDYSTEEALKTLWNAGLSPYNYTFSILVNEDNSERVEAAEIIADDLNRIGMNVTVVKKPYEDYLSLISADEFDAFIGGTNLRCGYDLRDFLSSGAMYRGTNYVNFSDSTMDSLLNAEASAVGEENTRAALREVERYISLQLPLIGIGFRDGAVLTSPEISGVTIPYINNCFVNVEDWSF